MCGPSNSPIIVSYFKLTCYTTTNQDKKHDTKEESFNKKTPKAREANSPN